MIHRPEIDGLRAVAVLLVLFYHAGLGCGGGYVGVDVFFVISGYLISGLILRDLDQDRFRLSEFWERRVRRIVPALVPVILFSLVAGWLFFLPQDFKELGQSVVAQVMLVSNVYFYKVSGYFEPAAELRPLLHTWSLAVEEQFYLAFPLLLMALKRASRQVLRLVILVMGVSSFLLSVHWSHHHAWANFFMLATRAWELLLGVWLATLLPGVKSGRFVRESCAGTGLLLIVGSGFLYNQDTRFPGAAALLPCGGTALIIWATEGAPTFVGKLLMARPVVWTGLISYSLYLWHWPLLVFPKYVMLTPPNWMERCLLLIGSVVLAALSWKFVETPFRRRKSTLNRARIFMLAGVSLSALLMMGLGIHLAEGVRGRIPPAALRYADGRADFAVMDESERAGITAESLQFANGRADFAVMPEMGVKEAELGDFITLGVDDQTQPVELLVWGDSHAWAVMPVLDMLCREKNIRGVGAAYSATVPLIQYESQHRYSLRKESPTFNDAVLRFIRSRHVPHVLLVASWNTYLTGAEVGRLRQAMQSTITALTEAGARVWIMKSVPVYPFPVPRALAMAVIQGRDPVRLGLPLAEHLEASLGQTEFFQALPTANVTVLDPLAHLCIDKKQCLVAADGQSLYRDNSHLSCYGASFLRPLFEPIFTGTKKVQGH